MPDMLALMVALCDDEDLIDGVLVTTPVREGRGDIDAEGEWLNDASSDAVSVNVAC